MKRKIFAIISILLLTVNTLTVSAEEMITVTEEGELPVTFSMEAPSTFEVSIPKNMTLSKGVKEDFEVIAKGDISGTKELVLTLGPSATLSSNGKPDETVAIHFESDTDYTENTSSQISLNFSSLKGEGTREKIMVNASDLSAGSWTASFTLNIQLKEITTK